VTINVTNDPPACSTTLTPTVIAGSTTTLATNCTDPNGQALQVTAVGAVAGGGSAAVTSPLSGSFTYTAPSTPTTATFSYSVSDGFGGTATGNVSVTVTLPPPYGFVNVQNLPASNKTTFKSGSTNPTKWQWTRNGVAVNTSGQAIVKAYSCAGQPLGTFTAQNPGNGNSFNFDASSNTWTFNWKLVGPTGANLPIGSYILQIHNSLTQQIDPNIINSTCGNQKGALVQVK
jgi:hypothetical protein